MKLWCQGMQTDKDNFHDVKYIQELIEIFRASKRRSHQRPHMKQPQTSLKEKPSWSLFRGGKSEIGLV